MRARRGPVSWLEDPFANGAFPRYARSDPLSCDRNSFLLQWRGRAGVSPDFRNGPVSL